MLNIYFQMMMKYSANVFALCLYEWTDEEGSGPLAMIIIPSLLALSTLIVVSQIIWSFVTKRLSAQVITASSSNVNGMWKRQQFEPKCQFIFSFIAWFFWDKSWETVSAESTIFQKGSPYPWTQASGLCGLHRKLWVYGRYLLSAPWWRLSRFRWDVMGQSARVS